MSNVNQLIERFEQLLIPQIYQSAWRYACYLCKTKEDAEDLLQESLVQALKHFEQLRDYSRFKSWLLTIIRNRYFQQYRRENRFLINGQASNSLLELIAYTPPETKHLMYSELMCHLQVLSNDQREALTLFYFEELSIKEIAQIQRVSSYTVLQRLHRARAKLKANLQINEVVR